MENGLVVSSLKLNLVDRLKSIPVSLSFGFTLALGLPLTGSIGFWRFSLISRCDLGTGFLGRAITYVLYMGKLQLYLLVCSKYHIL